MPASKILRLVGLLLVLLCLLLFSGRLQVTAQTTDTALLEQGAQLYAENCAVCHGQNGEGRIGATLSKDWPSIRPELTVRTIIEQGVSGSVMPAWGQEYGGPLSQGEVDALLVYILSWQTGGAPVMAPQPTATLRPALSPVPEVEGDPNRGGVLFDENCAMCHGPNAEGRIGATLAKAWPGIRPDLSIKTSISNGIPGSPMPAWSQSNGGPLVEQDINDLVAFILALPAAQVLQPTVVTPGSVTLPWMQGWLGVLVFIFLLALILVLAWVLQRRSQAG